MKANELMIGDWVKFTSKYGYGTGLVVGIEPREGSAEPTTFTIWKKDKEGNTKFFVGVSKNCVEPIPLTPKFLEKNGFKDSDFFGELLYKDWQIISDCHHLAARCGEGWNFDIPCKFVHELQHALRLCGIEKEITI